MQRVRVRVQRVQVQVRVQREQVPARVQREQVQVQRGQERVQGREKTQDGGRRQRQLQLPASPAVTP
jgi:hypothetical protein